MLRVFCDFDGTVALNDVGEQMFLHFGDGEAAKLGAQYLRREISGRECLSREIDLIQGVSIDDWTAYIDTVGIDPTFRDFSLFCNSKNIPLIIVSDGLDRYVGHILSRNGLNKIQFFANKLTMDQVDGTTRYTVSFPYTDSECLQCGNCKRNHLLTMSGEDDIIVYVGDGMSDSCPVHFADIVFAKGNLVKYCQKDNITYHEFKDFNDVQRRLESVLLSKRIKKRREADMARRDVFLQG
jgi:2-hydroxy-3-keto-5-methylthiopentenyl-1-phosphate phosphatase